MTTLSPGTPGSSGWTRGARGQYRWSRGVSSKTTVDIGALLKSQEDNGTLTNELLYFFLSGYTLGVSPRISPENTYTLTGGPWGFRGGGDDRGPNLSPRTPRWGCRPSESPSTSLHVLGWPVGRVFACIGPNGRGSHHGHPGIGVTAGWTYGDRQCGGTGSQSLAIKVVPNHTVLTESLEP